MTSNLVSASLASDDYQKVMGAIATIKETLSFSKTLSASDRARLPKLGDKSRAFVAKALEVAIQTPDFLPRAFDVDEMQRDVELFEMMSAIALSLMQLQELVSDTTIAVGSDAYDAALSVYAHARQNKDDFALDGVVQELGRRFAHKPKGDKGAA